MNLSHRPIRVFPGRGPGRVGHLTDAVQPAAAALPRGGAALVHGRHRGRARSRLVEDPQTVVPPGGGFLARPEVDGKAVRAVEAALRGLLDVHAQAEVHLALPDGSPVCAAVRPPAIAWSAVASPAPPPEPEHAV